MLETPKIIIGGAVSALIAILGFMGGGIVKNDNKNTVSHTEIRKEMLVGDTAVRRTVDKVEDIVTDIRIEQTEQRVILQTIAGKL